MREFTLPDIGTVRISKSKNAKRMTLRIKENVPHITIPKYSSYNAALSFADSKKQWIEDNTQADQTFTISDGVLFMNKELRLEPSDTSSRITLRESEEHITCIYPVILASDETELQRRLKNALKRFLRGKAKIHITPALKSLADEYGFSYESVSFPDLKSRWGSCDSKRHIKLSIYLTQLPFELIEYVIAHELTHTEHMNHSADFKNRLLQIMPDYPARRKKLKNYTNNLILL